jgi:hypothetical protein
MAGEILDGRLPGEDCKRKWGKEHLEGVWFLRCWLSALRHYETTTGAKAHLMLMRRTRPLKGRSSTVRQSFVALGEIHAWR